VSSSSASRRRELARRRVDELAKVEAESLLRRVEVGDRAELDVSARVIAAFLEARSLIPCAEMSVFIWPRIGSAAIPSTSGREELLERCELVLSHPGDQLDRTISLAARTSSRWTSSKSRATP
jgi:hypothetical protein